MLTRNTLRRYLLSTVGVTSFLVGAWAEQAAAEGIETVTVTARRQEESLLDAPVTVTAISGIDLRNQGITDVGSIIAMIPNAVVPDDPQHFQTYINIRGIRQADAQAEANFGIYRNGIYYGGQRSNLGSQVDLERVEVLRGPQAGLYGRDAVGGSVNVIYQTPSDEENGYVQAKYGTYNRIELEGALNEPITDKFAVRGAAWWFNQTGSEYFNITLKENIDRGHDAGGRLSARAELTPNFNVLWTAEYQDVEGPSQRAFGPHGIPAVITFFPFSAPETERTIQRDTPSRSKWHQFYVAQNATYDSSWGRFNLLASYRDYHLTGIEDQDFSNVQPTDYPLALKQVLNRAEAVRNFYVEGLWTSEQDQPLTWIAGVSYFGETFDFARIFTTSLDFDFIGIPIGVRTARGGLPLSGTNFQTRDVSVFGELTYKFTDQLEATAGVRWTQDKKTLNYAQAIIPTDPVSDPIFAFLFANVLPTFSLTDKPTFSFTAPTATVRYKPTETLNFYATYGSGFRAGGFNTTSTTPALIPYNQESAYNYEVGFKSILADGNVGLNGAVFYMTQRKMLLAQPDPIAPPQFNFTFLSNIGDAHTWGAELELVAHITDWLNGNASVGWLDPKFVGPATTFGIPIAGKLIPFTRRTTFNIGANVNHPITDDIAFVGNVELRLENGGFLDVANTIKYEPLTKLDATAGIELDGNKRLVGYIKNATNDRPVQFQFGNGAVATTVGRTYGVLLSMTFQ